MKVTPCPARTLLLLFLFVAAFAGLTRAQQRDTYALRGTLVTPQTIVPNGTLLVNGNQIAGVGATVNLPVDTLLLDTDSFIYPGLIDLHNHLTWNLFERWPPPKWKPVDWDPKQKFGARYDWQQLATYLAALSDPHGVLTGENLGCDMNRYGEVKAIAGGATSTVGSWAEPCIAGLARNLDFSSGFYPGGAPEKLSYEVFPFQLSVTDAINIRNRLTSGDLKAFIIHVAEGAGIPEGADGKSLPNVNPNASAAREFKIFCAQGFLHPGVSIVHGVAIGQAQFQEMASSQVGLIWSPRSNLELYGSTADVAAAKAAGVVTAIAPDWSPSGSSGMLEELKYASTWNAKQQPKIFSDADLVKMATIYPAQLAGLSGKIGSLTRGRFADLLLLKRKTPAGPHVRDPGSPVVVQHIADEAYATLVHATPLDVRLVVVGGTPVYGDRDLMEKLLPGQTLEPVSICDQQTAKVLYLAPDARLANASESWAETVAKLAAALKQIVPAGATTGLNLATLAEPSECNN